MAAISNFTPFTIASVLSSKINIWMFMTNELDTNIVEIGSIVTLLYATLR